MGDETSSQAGSQDPIAVAPRGEGSARRTTTTWRRVTPRWPWTLVAAGLVLRLALRLTVLDQVVDDAFIFFRYAENGARGAGLTYNHGDAVLGFTSPLYVLTLTGLAVVVGRDTLPGAAVVMDLALYLAASVALVRLVGRGVHAGSKPGVRHAAPVALLSLWAVGLPFVDGAINGMETMLFLALVLAAVDALDDGKAALAAALGGLLVLTRPEGAVVAALIGAVLLRRGRPLPWRGIAVAVIAVGAWAAAALVTYGSVVPQSLLAKSGQVTGAGIGDAGGPTAIAAQLALGVSSAQFATLPDVARAALTAVALFGAALCVGDLARRLRQGHAAAVMPGTYLGITVMYIVGDPVRVWSWYTVLTALAWAWSVSDVGAALLARWSPSRLRPVVASAVAVSVVAAAVATLVVGVPRRQDSTAGSVTELALVGKALADRVPRPATVMVGDIGAIGWETRATIVDLSGLVSVAPVEAAPTGAVPSFGALVDRFRPDAIVLQVAPDASPVVPEGSVIRQSFDDPDQLRRFSSGYETVAVEGSDRLVYVRRAG